MKLARKLSIGISRIQQNLGMANRSAMRLHEFDEDWYLATYPDVADAVRVGLIRTGRDHYIRHGFHEGRLRNAEADLQDIPTPEGFGEPTVVYVEPTTPSIDYVLRLPEQMVVIGRCGQSGVAADICCNKGEFLNIRMRATYHRADHGPLLGFMLVADLDDDRPVPGSLTFGSGDKSVRVPRQSGFGELCNFAPTEVVLQLLLATEQLQLSDDALATLTRTLRGRLLRSNRSYIETPMFAASIDSAVVGQTSGSLFFAGWLIHSRHAQQLDTHFVALSNRRPIPVTALTDFVERPDLKGFSGKYTVPVGAGFVGHAGNLGAEILGGDLVLVVKDSSGRFHTIHRTCDAVDEPSLHTTVVNQLATATVKFDGKRAIGALFADLFPFKIATPTPIVLPPGPRRGTGTCHLYLDVGSDPTELQSIVEEIIRDRFERLFVTCLSEGAEREISHALRAYAMSNPDRQITGRIVANRSAFLRVGARADARDLVIFGRPLDILQFDACHNAIDAAIKGDTAKCHGYFYHELSAIRLGEVNLSPDTLAGQLNDHLFESTTGFAAFMPLGYFKLLDLDKIPLAFPSNEVKALVLALAEARLAEIHFFGDTVFYGSAHDPDKIAGLDTKTLAQIDFFRTLPNAVLSDRRV